MLMPPAKTRRLGLTHAPRVRAAVVVMWSCAHVACVSLDGLVDGRTDPASIADGGDAGDSAPGNVLLEGGSIAHDGGAVASDGGVAVTPRTPTGRVTCGDWSCVVNTGSGQVEITCRSDVPTWTYFCRADRCTCTRDDGSIRADGPGKSNTVNPQLASEFCGNCSD